MDRMTINLLSGTDGWGGTEVHTVGLAHALAARGHDVCIVGLGHERFQQAGLGDVPFRIQTISLPGRVHELTFRQWRSLLRGLSGVGVLARWGLEVGSLALDLAARRHFERYIAIEHSSATLPPRSTSRHLGGLLPGLGLWWYRGWLTWHLRARAAGLIVCVSEATRRHLMDAYRVPARKLITIHNGTDTDRFGPSAEHRARSRQAWGVPDESLVFGTVGHLRPVKGPDVALDAFAQLAARHAERDVRLVLVGQGPEREALEERARAAGLSGRVVFAGFAARPWEAYAGLDVFLLPSRDEAMPLALLEAMACACCPVAMAVGGVPEVLSKSELGWLVPAGDRDAFLAGMEAAVALDAEARARMGQAARAHVVQHFNARTQFAALADLITEVSRQAQGTQPLGLPPQATASLDLISEI
jgi:glycosyltransferase involved in cell wall biosynthesis